MSGQTSSASNQNVARNAQGCIARQLKGTILDKPPSIAAGLGSSETGLSAAPARKLTIEGSLPGSVSSPVVRQSEGLVVPDGRVLQYSPLSPIS